jgi:histidine triad (HIT) family protein
MPPATPTTPDPDAPECFVCHKHQARGPLMPGGPVGEDDLVVVSHLAPGSSGRPVYLGHLFVEPWRHAPGLGDLTDLEARAVGWWCTRASRALREVAGAEHVYAAVIGDRVPHLHVHLTPRYPGTPPEYWWEKVAQWPDAPRGLPPQIADLVRDLRAYLNSGLPGS